MNQDHPSKEDINRMSLTEREAVINSDAPPDIVAYARLAVIPSYVNARQPEKIKPLLDAVLEYGLKNNDQDLLANCYRLYGWYYALINEFYKALEMLEAGLEHARQTHQRTSQMAVLAAYGSIYLQMMLYDKAEKYFKQEYELAQQYPEGEEQLAKSMAAKHMGEVLAVQGRDEEAIRYLEEGLERSPAERPMSVFFAALPLARIYLDKKDYAKAQHYLDIAEKSLHSERDEYAVNKVMVRRAEILYHEGQVDEAIHLFERTYDYFKEKEEHRDMQDAARNVEKCYAAKGQFEKAYHYLKEAKRLEALATDEEARRKGYALDAQVEMARKEQEFAMRLANTRLKTLTRITGEIAHEVQNPLQFVNNFSALNVELVEELKECLQAGDEKGITDTMQDLTDNCRKIEEYGIRISGIVDQLQEQTRKAQAGELDLDDDNPHDFSGG